jgi:ABC-type glycerol-3-phosphate transport system substrate-binding protein
MREAERHLAMALVAALLLAACGGGGGETTEAEQTESPAGDMQTKAPDADVVVTGTNSLDFVPSEVEAEAGRVSIALTSEGGPHTFTIELSEGDQTVAQVFDAGQPDIGQIDLQAGTYTFYCAIPRRGDGRDPHRHLTARRRDPATP